jgi:regulatory protein
VAQDDDRGDGRKARRAPVPLDAETLERLALHYVGRYATTRAKLASYLRRKLIERGWAGEGAAPVEALVARMAEANYVDDRGFAESRGGALARRGYGPRRIAMALTVAGISREDSAVALETAREDGWAAAIAFARRRRLGPFAAERLDRDAAQRAMGALLRAGHSPDHARAIVRADPGEMPDDPVA